MTAERRCPRCGTVVLPGDGGGESCRRCLLALGLTTGLAPDDDAPAGPGEEPGAAERAGPYRVLDLLGAGGAGVVYLAEPLAHPGRRLALKVVRAGPDTQEVLARFRVKQQVLNEISHPGLAKVFEAGVTEDGRVWFAMERVGGVPITEYCDRERLSTSRRLEIFIQLCEAIQHANERGVHHGNVKPSNVRVSEAEGRAEVRITDLGVARALDQGLTEGALDTAQGLLTATPAYVGPEQLDPAGEVDGRSDVYALGVLLYELLAGVPLFEPRTLRQAGGADLVRLIREEAPWPPSRRLRALDGIRAGEVAARRGTDALRLVGEIRGDLDAVCLKALEKEPGRRYPTPGHLGLDLRRHLDGEVVSASAPGLRSRLRRGWLCVKRWSGSSSPPRRA